jgi:hypothetical protein
MTEARMNNVNASTVTPVEAGVQRLFRGVNP